MRLPPWDYLFLPFTPHNFPDLFTPMWIASLALLVTLVVLYNVRTRALHRHAPYLDLWEWLLWSGLSPVRARADGVGVLVRVHRPARDPRRSGSACWSGSGSCDSRRSCAGYEVRLAKQRYYTKTKFSRPETTIRAKPARRSKRRR